MYYEEINLYFVRKILLILIFSQFSHYIFLTDFFSNFVFRKNNHQIIFNQKHNVRRKTARPKCETEAPVILPGI